MADYGFEEPSRRESGLVWDLLSLLLLLFSVCLIGYFGLVFINPYTGLNPFPPPTMPVPFVPTVTPTLPFITLPAPPTATFTPSPTATWTATPTQTAVVTPFPVGTTPAPVVTTPPPTALPYVLQAGTPTYMPSTVWHPESGCNYLGVAGQIFAANNQPLTNAPIVVWVSGQLAGVELNQVALPGTAPHVGPAGFEIALADHPVASQGTVYIQLLDLNTQLPLSDAVFFETKDSCEQNIVLINFVQRPAP